MARPTSATTVQRPDLGQVAYEYMLDASQRGFIGLDVLPIFEVPEQSADYPVIPIESLLKIPDTKRAPRGNYNRGDYEFEMGTYACQEYGHEEPIDDAEKNLYSRLFDAEMVAVQRAVDTILRGHEQRVASAVFNSGTFTVSNVGTEWSTASSCTPRANVIAGKQAMRAASGLEPNVLVMSKKVFENLLLSAEVSNVFQYTNPIQSGTMEGQRRVLAQYLGVDEILVGGAIKDSAKKGQSFSIADIWDDEYVGLVKTASGMNLREPALGRTFLWTGDSPSIITTESYREEQTRSDVYRVRQNVDEAFVFTNACYLLGNITA